MANTRYFSLPWSFLSPRYVATQALVFAVYRRAASERVPPWVLVLLCLSKRMHSVYVLRLFNDCWAMFLLYAALLLFTYRSWKLGCVLFSLAVSVKMNVMLFAPALQKKVGIANAMMVGSAMQAFGTYMGSLQTALAPFLFWYSCFFGTGIGLAYTAPLVLGFKWFPGE